MIDNLVSLEYVKKLPIRKKPGESISLHKNLIDLFALH